MPTRPTVIPIWTQGNPTQRQQPSDGDQTAGFNANQRPPAKVHNWLFGIFSDWIDWLDYATQGNGPVSNVGHNILTGTTVQEQFDEADAFLSSLSFQPLILSPTSNPLVFTTSQLPLNGAPPMVFLDGLDEDPTTDFTFTIVSGVGHVNFAVAPAPGQKPVALALTASNPGTGGSSINGGFVVYNTFSSPGLVTAVGGITSTSSQRALLYMKGNGGNVVVTASPAITPGSKDGQEMRIVGCDNAAKITLNDNGGANGIQLNASNSAVLGAGQSIDFWWSAGAALWIENDRSN